MVCHLILYSAALTVAGCYVPRFSADEVETISRRERPTPMSKKSLELSPPNSALSPATRGTPSALSRQAGGQC